MLKFGNMKIKDIKDSLNIDFRYIIGRDNYSCAYCHQELLLEDLHISKINPQLECSNDNIVVSCEDWGCDTSQISEINFPQTAISGRLVVIASCMFSEKTTITKSLLNKYSRVVGEYIWVKPDIDIRGKGITTHNKEEIDAEIISASRPDSFLDKLSNYSIIAFDEVQFYSERILYVIHQLLKKGKLVIVNGLKLDYKRNIFGMIHYLLAEADDIISPKAICNVCNKIDIASRTKKKLETGPVIEVGGADMYICVCADCDSKVF